MQEKVFAKYLIPIGVPLISLAIIRYLNGMLTPLQYILLEINIVNELLFQVWRLDGSAESQNDN